MSTSSPSVDSGTALDPRITALLDEVGVDSTDLDGITARIDGADPVHPTPYPIGEAAATAIGSAATIAAAVWRDATGQGQDVRVDVGRSAASLLSFLLQRLDGPPLTGLGDRSAATALYPTGDDRWIHLHGGFPHLAAGTATVLGCDATAVELRAATRRWEALALEEALAEAGMCGAMVRTLEEWQAHPQAQAIAPLGRVTVRKIADGDARPACDGRRPFGAVRLLDLTRLLAGPTAGRTLAEHGADVLLVNSPRLDNIDPFVIDTSHGKRSAYLELDDPDDAARLRTLAAGADVFVQGYRGGSLDRRGFDAETLAEGHPGLVHVSVNCYGSVGPWRLRPGWEQMAQSVTGLCAGHGRAQSGDAATPSLIPAAVCDYTTGYLAAVGAAAALRRRAIEGGSYVVQASLCQTAGWISSLGPSCDPAAAIGLGGLVSDGLLTSETGWGTLRHFGPVAQLSATPARWDRPPSPLGTHDPAWLVEPA